MSTPNRVPRPPTTPPPPGYQASRVSLDAIPEYDPENPRGQNEPLNVSRTTITNPLSQVGQE